MHRDALNEIPNAKLVGVASRSAQKAEAFSKSSGDCEWMIDYKQLIKRNDIDIVCVTTSSGSHYSIGEAVLQAGKHVVLEKPIALRAVEARQLINLANERGLTLTVISQRRFEPNIAYVKKVLANNGLGKILLIEVGTPYNRTQEYYDSADWRGSIAEDGGALMNQGIHQIDLLLWFGGRVKSVYGATATMKHRMEAEDLGTAIVKFESGAIGTIMSSTCVTPNFPAYIHIYGENGTVKIHGQEIVFWSVEGAEAPERKHSPESDGSFHPLAISHAYHKRQLQNVLQSLEHGEPLAVTGSDGMLAVELVQSIVASSETGMEIQL